MRAELQQRILKRRLLPGRTAQKLGVDLALVQGSGAGGKRMKADVEMAAAKQGRRQRGRQTWCSSRRLGLAVGKMDNWEFRRRPGGIWRG